MENQEAIPTLTVYEKPELKDQVTAAVAGSLATIVATAVVSTGAELLKMAIENRNAKKLKKDLDETEKD